MRIILSILCALCALCGSTQGQGLNLRDPAFLALLAPVASSSSSTSVPPVSGFTMWLDFSDATTIFTNLLGTSNAAPNDLVMRINDKSATGTNFVTVENAGNRGTYRTTNMFSTGLSGVYAGFYVTSNFTTLGSSNTGAITIFTAMRPTIQGIASEPNGPVWMLGGNASSVGHTLRRNSADFTLEITDGSTGNPFVRDTFTNQVTFAFCAQIDTVGDTYIIWNGYDFTLTGYSGNLTMDANTRKMCLGQLWGFGSWQWYCNWGEFIVYPRQLTGLEVTNTQTYLINKWGARSGH